MTDEELKGHALRIAASIAEDTIGNVEYCYVYEDEELEHASEEVWEAVLDIIRERVKVTLTLD